MQSVAAQRPFFFDHIRELTEQAFAEYAALTGRGYARVMSYRADDADYLGPFNSRAAAERSLAALHDTFPIRQCSGRLPLVPAPRRFSLVPGHAAVPPDSRLPVGVRHLPRLP